MSSPWQALDAALTNLHNRDQTTPCQHPKRRDRWTSDCDEERLAASLECRLCPIVTECLNAARDMKTPVYVWGGHDFGTQAVRKQKQR